jgi:CubicO group peptidase (beta-lactamase class C family)
VATDADLERVVAPHYRGDGPGAAVAVRQHGELLLCRGYGLANLEWNIPVDADTVFRLGSITKQFTAAAIMKLGEEGALDLEDPIQRHLADYPVKSRPITIRSLLNHTSGVRGVTELPNWPSLMNSELPLAGMIDVFKDLPLDFEPQDEWRYSNSGYILLGAIIERISGKRLGGFLRDAFFTRLGMTSTCYLHDRPVIHKRAAGYELHEGRFVNATPMSMNWPHGAGALGSSANDLLRWEEALHSGRVVSPASYEAMTTPTVPNNGVSVAYGFGLNVPEYRGRRFVSHTGGINGFMANLCYWPDEDLTIVVLSNAEPSPVHQITYALARRVLGLPDAAHSAVKLSAPQLGACVGLYRHHYGEYRVKVEAEMLVTSERRLDGQCRFRPMAEGAFFMEQDPEVTMTFSNLAGGAYQTMSIGGYGEPFACNRAKDDAPLALVPRRS